MSTFKIKNNLWAGSHSIYMKEKSTQVFYLVTMPSGCVFDQETYLWYSTAFSRLFVPNTKERIHLETYIKEQNQYNRLGILPE
jgi:hypothetical protein